MVDHPYPVHDVSRASGGAEKKLSAVPCGCACGYSVHVIPIMSFRRYEGTMGAGLGQELYSSCNHTDVGIVMLGEFLQLHYVNDRARNYMDRAGSMDAALPHKHDLRLEIIELGTQIRERDTVGSWPHPDGVEARKTVRTKQGTFHLRALRVLDRSQRVGQQIMILIEDCVNGRLPSKSPEVAR